MISGKLKKEYRDIQSLNYSSIKIFDNDGPAVFYDSFILGKPRKEPKDNTHLLIGSLVDDMLLTCHGDEQIFEQMFNDKYSLSTQVKNTSQAFILADKLFVITLRDSVDGVVKTQFETRFREALDQMQTDGYYKGKSLSQALEDFNSKVKDYFDTKINNIGKQIVDFNHLTKAKLISEQLLNDDFTSDLLRKEKLTKYVAEFTYKDLDCKCELDAIDIDEENKIVQPYDLKCTYDNEGFEYAYIKHSYYLQQAFYRIGLQSSEEFKGYTILPMKFIVSDTSVNNRRPLIYELDENDFLSGVNGFTFKGNVYRGIDELIDEIKWHKLNNIWNISKKALENSGKLKLHICYDK